MATELRHVDGKPEAATELTALAGWIDEQLDDETTGRQWIAEKAAGQVREITLRLLGVAEQARQSATGPFATAAQARDLPAVRAIWDRWRVAYPRPGAGRALRAEGAGLIEAACEQAGVVIGAHDRQLINWLAGFGPEYCAVFAGLISRANLGLVA